MGTPFAIATIVPIYGAFSIHNDIISDGRVVSWA